MWSHVSKANSKKIDYNYPIKRPIQIAVDYQLLIPKDLQNLGSLPN